MLMYVIVAIITVGCDRLRLNNQEEKVLPSEHKREIEVMEEEMRIKRVENIDLESRTSKGYTPFHIAFVSRIGSGYLLLRKILSSPLTKEVKESKKAKMVSAIEDEREIAMARELINKQDKYGRTPLKLGVEENSIEIIRACVEDESLREVIDWNKIDDRGVSPILEATLRENLEMCELLERVARKSYKKRILRSVEEGKRVVLEDILRRVDVNRYEGGKAVSISIEREDIETLCLLIKYGAQLGKRLQAVVVMLIKEREEDIYEELLEMTEIRSKEMLDTLMRGVEEREEGKTALMYAIEGECSIEVLKKIVTRMSVEEVLKKDREGRGIEMYESAHKEYLRELYNIYTRAEEGVLPKISALSYGGNIELVERLIEEGADVNETDKDIGMMQAVCVADAEIVSKLERLGVTIYIIDRDTYVDVDAALIRVTYFENAEIVATLEKLGANIEDVDRAGETALMCATYAGNIEVVSQLVELGADIEAVDIDGDTALAYAVYVENVEMVSKLLELGANTEVVNEDGSTILMLAIKKGNMEVVLKLIESGANIDAADRDGDTVLMYAVYSDNVEIVSKLIELGVNKSAINEQGDTALIIAVESGNVKLVSKLLKF